MEFHMGEGEKYKMRKLFNGDMRMDMKDMNAIPESERYNHRVNPEAPEGVERFYPQNGEVQHVDDNGEWRNVMVKRRVWSGFGIRTSGQEVSEDE